MPTGADNALIDAAGTYHYFDGLHHFRLAGGAWEPKVNWNNSGCEYVRPWLAHQGLGSVRFDRSGKIHLSASCSGGGGSAAFCFYATNTTGAWSTHKLGAEDCAADRPRLGIAADGSVYIVYRDLSVPNRATTIVADKKANNSFGAVPVGQTLDGVGNGSIGPLDVAVDLNGHLHIVEAMNGALRFLTNSTGTWQEERIYSVHFGVADAVSPYRAIQLEVEGAFGRIHKP